MAQGFKKHRKAKDVYALNFTGDLLEMGAGVTLTGSPTMTAAKKISGGGWQDKTAEVLEGTPTIIANGTKIQFTVKAAGVGEQVAGLYGVFASATTSDGRIAVGTASLKITDEVTG